MRLKPICVGSSLLWPLPKSSFVGDNRLLFCCSHPLFLFLVEITLQLQPFLAYQHDVFLVCWQPIAFKQLAHWKFVQHVSNSPSLYSFVMILYIIVSSFFLLILNIASLHQKPCKSQKWNPHQKPCKSQKWNPHQNLQYHSRKLSWLGFHHIFIDLLSFKFVEKEIRRETIIKIVKANNLIKKHNNWMKLQVDEKLFLHSSMLKIKIFFTI